MCLCEGVSEWVCLPAMHTPFLALPLVCVSLTALRHPPQSEKNGRIAQHYKFALTTMFDRFPDAGACACACACACARVLCVRDFSAHSARKENQNASACHAPRGVCCFLV